jgi:hypothetical protein
MIHAFMLMVLMADKQQPNPMYFRSIDVCQYYAVRVVRQYGNYDHSYLVPKEHRLTAYCKPVKVQDGPNIYDH